MRGHYNGPATGPQCPAVGQLDSTTPGGQWCNHSNPWHRTSSSAHPPQELVLQRQCPDHSAAADRNYFHDDSGRGGGEFTTFVDWDAGNDVMSVGGRCHGDESCDTVASEHVYEIAA